MFCWHLIILSIVAFWPADVAALSLTPANLGQGGDVIAKPLEGLFAKNRSALQDLSEKVPQLLSLLQSPGPALVQNAKATELLRFPFASTQSFLPRHLLSSYQNPARAPPSLSFL